MALLLTEQDVATLLTVPDCMEAVEEAFKRQDAALVQNHPRRRLRVPNGILHAMEAADLGLGRMGLKVYTSFGARARFLVLLYDSSNGDLLALIEADRLGQIRTGAATGVATRYMAREDASVLGLLGAGWQAETQALAVAQARTLSRILVFSRTAEKRETFAERLTRQLGVAVEPVSSPEQAVTPADIVVTATTSRAPVLAGKWLRAGAHVNAIGSNSLARAEVDEEAVSRAGRVVVDSLEQSRMEAGDLLHPVELRRLRWEQVYELRELVAGRREGRTSPEEITLFKSNGVALQDVAAASLVYDRAVAERAGREVALWE